MLGKPDSRNLALMCILKRKITLQCIESVEVSFYVNQSMSKVTQAPGGGGALLGILGGSETNKQSVYPLSDQNGAKTLPDGAAYTYMADIRE